MVNISGADRTLLGQSTKTLCVKLKQTLDVHQHAADFNHRNSLDSRLCPKEITFSFPFSDALLLNNRFCIKQKSYAVILIPLRLRWPRLTSALASLSSPEEKAGLWFNCKQCCLSAVEVELLIRWFLRGSTRSADRSTRPQPNEKRLTRGDFPRENQHTTRVEENLPVANCDKHTHINTLTLTHIH